MFVRRREMPLLHAQIPLNRARTFILTLAYRLVHIIPNSGEMK
jgi:hypothetical protein